MALPIKLGPTLPIMRGKASRYSPRRTPCDAAAIFSPAAMINTLYLPEIREMLESGDAEGMREFCTALHPARTAEFMEGLTAAETWAVLQAAEQDTRVAIFSYLDRQKQIEIIETCDPESVAPVIADMPADDRVDLLNAVDEEISEQVTALVPVDKRRDIF